MVNRLVSVGDDFTLPGVVAVADTNLPAHAKAAAIAAKLDSATAATTYAAKSVETSKLDASQKGAASGVAALDVGSKLLEANIPGRLSDASLTATYALKSEVGAAAGVTFVTLNSVGQSVTIPDDSVVGLALVQGTGGSKTASWPTGIRWDGGTAPTLSTAGGAVDVVTLVADGSGGWLGKLDGRYSGPPDTTNPSALTGLTAGTATDTTIPLSWTAATDNVAVTGYEYSTNAGSSWTSTGSTGTTYTITGLNAGTSYTILVRAFDAAGNKGTSASVTKSTTGSVVPYDTAVAADTPVHWLKFDGNATDSGSRAHAFTATALTYGTSLGDTTQAGVFDGATSKVVGPNTTGTGILGATTATVEALVKTAAATFGTVMAQNGALTFAVNASRQVEMTYYVATVAKKVTTTATLTVGTTYHVAGVFDGTNVIVYINGVASGTLAASGALATSAASLNIGMFSNNLWFNGSIDGVAVYNTALSAGRILAHAQGAGLA